LTSGGNIYSSGYYHSDTGSLTLHAEQGALAHAAAHGEYEIITIAVTWNEAAFLKNKGNDIYPCHVCKQLLWESSLRSKIDTQILIVKNGKIIERIKLSDMMPYAWPR
jgi:cytidine deaminase